jgi:hypothetical protein
MPLPAAGAGRHLAATAGSMLTARWVVRFFDLNVNFEVMLAVVMSGAIK